MKCVFLFFFLITSSVFGRSSFDYSVSGGPIAIGVGLGYGGYRILNSDGSWAAYNGISYTGSLDVKVFRSQTGSFAFSLFGDYTFAKANDSEVSSSKLEHSATSFGVRVYPNDIMYMGIGYGQGDEKLSDTLEISLKHSFTKMSLGFVYDLKGSWSIGLQGNYRSGSIDRMKNSSLDANSSFEALESVLFLNWSPKVLNIITSDRSF